MKGSDIVEMIINIGGEPLKIDVPFNEQNIVRDAERDVKHFIDRLKKTWPDTSDKNIFAMAIFQYAKWCHQLVKIQEEAESLLNDCSHNIDNILTQAID